MRNQSPVISKLRTKQLSYLRLKCMKIISNQLRWLPHSTDPSPQIWQCVPRRWSSTKLYMANCMQTSTHSVMTEDGFCHLLARRQANHFWYAAYSQWRTPSVEHTRGVKETLSSSEAEPYLAFFADSAWLAMASNDRLGWTYMLVGALASTLGLSKNATQLPSHTP